MLGKVGLISFALLLSSRISGMARESAQAAAFGTSATADVVVLMLTLPDWIASLVAGGALAYVLLPRWAMQSPAQQAKTQHAVARNLLALGGALGLVLAVFPSYPLGWLVAGLPSTLEDAAEGSLRWSAAVIPAACLAALWSTRLQHERDFVGMYSASLIVNGVLIVALWLALQSSIGKPALMSMGVALLIAMLLRLGWLLVRMRKCLAPEARGMPQVLASAVVTSKPPQGPRVWLWATLAAGLPLALPFVARSLASKSGEGALATFNYAWKLVELPLILAIQLVASLAFPSITQAMLRQASQASALSEEAIQVVGQAFAMAWALACGAAAALLVGAPVLAQLLFGWGRMDAIGLRSVADWGAIGAWSLLPQALIAVALTVLATQQRMGVAVGAYACALALLVLGGWAARLNGAGLMELMGWLLCGVAMVCLVALGSVLLCRLRWLQMLASGAGLLAVWGGSIAFAPLLSTLNMTSAVGVTVACAGLVMAIGWLAGPR